jgi:hypothetical protein
MIGQVGNEWNLIGFGAFRGDGTTDQMLMADRGRCAPERRQK